MLLLVTTHADCCMSVYPDDISNVDAAMFTKLDTKMLHSEKMSLKKLFWGQKVKGQGHEAQKTAPLCVFTLLRVLPSSTS